MSEGRGNGKVGGEIGPKVKEMDSKGQRVTG